MSGEAPQPIDDPADAPSPSHVAARVPGMKRPPAIDMSEVPEPRWLKHSVTAIDIFAGVLCAIVVRWMGGDLISLLGLPVSPLSYCCLIAGIAAIGWVIRRRAWAISFVAGTIAIPLGLLPIG